MSEPTQEANARIGRGPRLSAIWLVPVVAALIGAWMVYSHWASQGPMIQIAFQTANGIEAGKTKIKMKNVEIGEVLNLRLSEDADSVVLYARIEKSEAKLLREDSVFWVVRPRVGAGGVTGLSTLLSGAFIEFSPGTAENAAREFVGEEAPPVTPPGTPGLHLTLDSDGNRPLTEGDPILFHGMEVGRVEYVHFNTRERRTYYNAFIAAPYDRLITSNTRFWFSSGLSVDLSADGMRVDVASLATLIAGGVSFDLPSGQPPGEQITQRAEFHIYPRERDVYEQHYEHALSFAVLFGDSIRGLSPGAPVEYRGIRVGEVLRTDTNYPEIGNLLEPASKIPVIIKIEPARLGFDDSAQAVEVLRERMASLIEGGLRGGLTTGSLLTGQKYVELKYHAGAGGEQSAFAGYSVIPSVDGQLGQILASVESTLQSINRLPLDKIAASAQRALDEVAGTLVEFRKSATQLDTILGDPSTHELVSTLNETLVSFQQLARGFSEGSSTHRELQRSLQGLERTLRELEPVLRNLRRKPNSLIFSGDDEADLEPKGAHQ